MILNAFLLQLAVINLFIIQLNVPFSFLFSLTKALINVRGNFIASNVSLRTKGARLQNVRLLAALSSQVS